MRQFQAVGSVAICTIGKRGECTSRDEAKRQDGYRRIVPKCCTAGSRCLRPVAVGVQHFGPPIRPVASSHSQPLNFSSTASMAETRQRADLFRALQNFFDEGDTRNAARDDTSERGPATFQIEVLRVKGKYRLARKRSANVTRTFEVTQLVKHSSTIGMPLMNCITHYRSNSRSTHHRPAAPESPSKHL